MLGRSVSKQTSTKFIKKIENINSYSIIVTYLHISYERFNNLNVYNIDGYLLL